MMKEPIKPINFILTNLILQDVDLINSKIWTTLDMDIEN